MHESRRNQPESNEITQDQKREFADMVEELTGRFGLPSLIGDTQATFQVAGKLVEVSEGELDVEGIDRKAWNVNVRDADASKLYLIENYEVSKDPSGTGLGAMYMGELRAWDDESEKYIKVQTKEIQALSKHLREMGESGTGIDSIIYEAVRDRPDKQLEEALGLGIHHFTSDRYERVMGFLQQCGPDNLVDTDEIAG